MSKIGENRFSIYIWLGRASGEIVGGAPGRILVFLGGFCMYVLVAQKFCGINSRGKKGKKKKRGRKKMLAFYAKLFLFLLQKTIYLGFLFGCTAFVFSLGDSGMLQNF